MELATTDTMVIFLSSNLHFLDTKSLNNLTHAGTLRITMSRGKFTFTYHNILYEFLIFLLIFHPTKVGNGMNIRVGHLVKITSGFLIFLHFLGGTVRAQRLLAVKRSLGCNF